MATWKLPQGAGDSYTVPIVDPDGAVIAYAGTEALAGNIWPGGTRASLATLTPVWLSPVGGTTTVAITAAQTTALAPALYSVRCTITTVAGVRDYYRGSLQIVASPGTATVPPVYTDDDDLRTYAAWIDDLQGEGDQAGFAGQCAQARTWLDEILISRWKFIGSPQIGDLGYGAWTLFGGNDPVPSKYIRDLLAANRLMVRDVTKEIVAKRALYYVCAAQLGKNGDHSYQDLARRFRFESEEMVKTYRAEIDLNADGVADMFINCGATSLR